MAYYDIIRSPAVFSKQASAEGMESFESLYKSKDFDCGVSRWGRKHLFASRVLCNKPQRRLSLFVDGDFFPGSARGVHECIDRLIAGPGTSIMKLSEPQIVQYCQPDSLGYVWAALAEFLREDQANMKEPDKETRTRVQVSRYGDFVSTASYQIGSSSPTRPGSASASSESSTGFIQQNMAPPLEELSIRLLSCFIRSIIDYAQPVDKTLPFIRFRDQRLTSSYKTAYKDDMIRSTDDGGLQICTGEEMLQVASLEGKRSFQTFDKDGKPTVSDQTLGQIVGEALALRRAEGIESVAKSGSLFIVLPHQAHGHLPRQSQSRGLRMHSQDRLIRTYDPQRNHQCKCILAVKSVDT